MRAPAAERAAPLADRAHAGLLTVKRRQTGLWKGLIRLMKVLPPSPPACRAAGHARVGAQDKSQKGDIDMKEVLCPKDMFLR